MSELRKDAESGQSLVLTALIFAFVVIPLFILVIDGTRLWRIRNRLQTATDAACEDAAISAVDIHRFQQSGNATFQSGFHIWNIAQSTFQDTLSEQGQMSYSAGIQIFPDYAVPNISCTSSALVPLMIWPGSVSLSSEAISEIRFIRR